MQRRSRKDWPSLAWWLIDICIINSYTLWRLDKKADISQLDFCRALLRQMPTAYPPPSTPTHTAPSTPPIIIADGHWPKHMEKSRDCRHCTQGREKEGAHQLCVLFL